jgi:AraC-like DNA-binding protein
MKYVLNGRNITFINKKLTSERVNQQFAQLTDALASRNPKAIASLLEKLIGALKFYSCENEQVNDGNFFRDFKEINSYIENNIEERFCLDELSKMANINKYGFVKKFKASTGMTPMNYILMKKIFSCKNLIQPHSELTELAYRYGFSDLSHFSRTFKSYVGISPKNYQSNLIQDS